jgi:hypothetical protein
MVRGTTGASAGPWSIPTRTRVHAGQTTGASWSAPFEHAIGRPAGEVSVGYPWSVIRPRSDACKILRGGIRD